MPAKLIATADRVASRWTAHKAVAKRSSSANQCGGETDSPARMACCCPRAACPWSTGRPGRRAGEQAALGKADTVDQDHPEDEADQARRHAELPIEFRQIDGRQHKRRR